MAAYAIDRRDIDFVLYEVLEAEGLAELEPYRELGRDIYDHVLDEAIRVAEEVLFPANAPGDEQGCRWSPEGVRIPEAYRDVYGRFCEGHWIAMSGDPERGGMGLPYSVALCVLEVFMGANPAFMMYPGLSVGAGSLLDEFGATWMKDTVVPRLYAGEWQGTMALTEPQAGSAVGALTTKAVPAADGDHYLIEGRKIFISCAEHDLTDNHMHLVLARIAGDPGGTRGISIFLVPKHDIDQGTGALGGFNHVRCTGIERKMGIHGSATCALSFGETGPCKGYLIGAPRDGMRIMFKLMNEARILTGMQGLSAAGVVHELARAYARERVQGTRPEDWDAEAPEQVAIERHPDVRRMLLDMKATVSALRALLYSTARLADVARHHADEATRERCRERIELLTPICKAFSTDQGFRVTETAIQVLGGYGYCSDYGIEQYCRDTKISSIYEGTNGIQALDLLGRKLGMKGGKVFMAYIDDVNATIERASGDPELAPIAEALGKARGRLLEVAMKFMTLGQGGDRVYPVLNATPFLELFGYVVCAHLLLEQAEVALARLRALEDAKGASRAALIEADADARFYAGKLACARYWAAWRLPRVHAIGKGILSEDRSALEDVL